MKNLISLANSLQFHQFTQELLNDECQYDPSAYTEKLMRNKRLQNSYLRQNDITIQL